MPYKDNRKSGFRRKPKKIHYTKEEVFEQFNKSYSSKIIRSKLIPELPWGVEIIVIISKRVVFSIHVKTRKIAEQRLFEMMVECITNKDGLSWRERITIEMETEKSSH